MGEAGYWSRARSAWDERAKKNVEGYTSAAPTTEEHERRGRADAATLAQLMTGAGARWNTGLELGCGDGRLLQHFAPKFKTLHGCDISAEMLDLARQRVPGATFHHLSSEGLPVADLDVIYSYGVFQHVPRTVFRSYVKGVARALAPGGLFVFHIQRPYSLKRKLKAMFGGEKVTDDTWNIRYYTWGRLRKWAKEEKLEVVAEQNEKLVQYAVWKKPAP